MPKLSVTKRHPTLRAELRRGSDDAGFAMILVVGFSVIVLAIVSLSLTVALRALRSSADHVSYETSLDVAETGIDAGLARLQEQFNVGGVSYVSPSPTDPSCAAAVVDWTGKEFASAEEERQLAKATLLSLADFPGCLQTTPAGQYVLLKPFGRQTVYALGWSPSRLAPHPKVHLLKAEYIFGPYKPKNAVLTGGTLDISGSVFVDALNVPAGVHSNSSITTKASDTICGPVTASGSYDNAASTTCGSPATNYSSQSGSGYPVESIPGLLPRTFYTQQNGSGPTTSLWYDLCPDGSVRPPSAAGPCLAATTYSTAGASFNGWDYTAGSLALGKPATWTMSMTDSPYAGVYYVYRGDAVINGKTSNGGSAWQGTVLAESDTTSGTGPAASCGAIGGSIDWKLGDIANYTTGLVFDAQNNLNGSARSNAGDGFFIAGNQIHLSTSSATITGALLSSNICTAGGNSTVQGVTIHFDQLGDSPITGVINTTLWLQFAVG